MTDFAHFVPEIRADFDKLEDEFLSAAPTILKGTSKEKQEFMDNCFERAEQATDRWIQMLASRDDLAFEDEAYRGMWDKHNRTAEFEGVPAAVVQREFDKSGGWKRKLFARFQPIFNAL